MPRERQTPEPRTPEEHHTMVMDAIDREVERFGPESLAGMIAAEYEAREAEADGNNDPHAMRQAREFADLFERTADDCLRLQAKHRKESVHGK